MVAVVIIIVVVSWYGLRLTAQGQSSSQPSASTLLNARCTPRASRAVALRLPDSGTVRRRSGRKHRRTSGLTTNRGGVEAVTVPSVSASTTPIASNGSTQRTRLICFLTMVVPTASNSSEIAAPDARAPGRTIVR